MGATEDFLAEMQKRRKMQLDQIKGLFDAQKAPDIQTPGSPGHSSLIGGLLKQGLQNTVLSSATKYFGNPGGGGGGTLTPGTAGANPQNSAFIPGVGVPGFGAAGSSAGGLIGASGIPASVANPATMALTGPATFTAGAAAPAVGAAAASPGLLSGVGSAIGGAGSAIGGAASGLASAVGSAISYIASLFSTERMKHEIELHKQVGELRWVSYKYLPQFDPSQEKRIGLIAEELVQTHPEWVVRGADRKPLGIHYGEIPRHLWP